MQNSNLIKRKPEKKKRTTDVERHWSSFEVRDLPRGKQIELAEELMEYVRQPHRYTITGFLAQKYISKAVWHDWCNRYTIIAAAHENARMHLGAKRFDAGASKEGAHQLMNMAAQYDTDLKNHLIEMEQARARKDDQKATEIHLHLDNFGLIEDEQHIPISSASPEIN